ncbi:beta-1,4-glucuronyltransferase 1-like isoform X2 [Penaeus japonicus]|uniref:beta-1,4-glucuronyltransferase 1-like isoform X2 n=1 Tax=Penaeus japonicus TaxID=27405 RepID=UPI001C71486F|nr:beta-1,4-glucuronyltransferase 1-like isoform X2 [Penaeus japonicus]
MAKMRSTVERRRSAVAGGESGGGWWACGRLPGMVWTRAWRRWQRWACVGVGVVVGAWLLLAAPCGLLACPPRETAEAHPAAEGVHVTAELDTARLLCTYLSSVPPQGRSREAKGSPQSGDGGPYSVMYDWIASARSFAVNESVTYTTHTTPEMVNHVAELATRWSGPLSVAVFVPHSDFCLAAVRIARLRLCGPPEVREKVSWHLFWPRDVPPAGDWRLVVDETLLDCAGADEAMAVRGYRAREIMAYPVNVARNVARTAAPTWFVLPSDVELYPSADLAQQFVAMMARVGAGQDKKVAGAWPRVFVVPVFEVASVVPENKEELVRQYQRSDAVYFHRHVCAHCQRFPALNDWIRQPGKPGLIQAFSVVKRQYPYHRWEPIYICTKDEPLYDERLSWEGLQDKMTQMHELCLRGYNLVILDRAFLVHAPGIKRRSKTKAKDNAWRDPFVAKNSRVYDKIMEEMQNKFGPSDVCHRH